MNKHLKATLLITLIGIPLYLLVMAAGYGAAASNLVIPDLITYAILAAAAGTIIGIVVGWFMRLGKQIGDLHRRALDNE